MIRLNCRTHLPVYGLAFLSLMSSGCQQQESVDSANTGAAPQTNSNSFDRSASRGPVTALVIEGAESKMATLQSMPNIRISSDRTSMSIVSAAEIAGRPQV